MARPMLGGFVMSIRPSPTVLLLLSLAGVTFSGYLSLRLYTTNSCAFDESCPVVGGIPACYVGLAFFLTLAFIQLAVLRRRITLVQALGASVLIAATGVVFAGYASATELQAWWLADSGYGLGLPTCFYGAVFFALVLGVALAMLGSRQRRVG